MYADVLSYSFQKPSMVRAADAAPAAGGLRKRFNAGAAAPYSGTFADLIRWRTDAITPETEATQKIVNMMDMLEARNRSELDRQLQSMPEAPEAETPDADTLVRITSDLRTGFVTRTR